MKDSYSEVASRGHPLLTSKYFEMRFNHMQGQMDNCSGDLNDFRDDIDKRSVILLLT